MVWCKISMLDGLDGCIIEGRQCAENMYNYSIDGHQQSGDKNDLPLPRPPAVAL